MLSFFPASEGSYLLVIELVFYFLKLVFEIAVFQF